MSLVRLPRRIAGLVCRLMVGVLLFAQLATAAYACGRLAPPAATAMATGGMATEMAAAGAPCHQVDTDTPNLCVEHCRAGQQSADHAAAPLLADAVFVPLYALAPDADAPSHRQVLAAARGLALAAPPPPPHTVLHCCRRD